MDQDKQRRVSSFLKDFAVLASSKRDGTPHAFTGTQVWLRVAGAQNERINAAPDVNGSSEVIAAVGPVFVDVLLYFIALENVWYHLSQIREDPTFSEVTAAIDRLNENYFRQCFDAMHTLESMQEQGIVRRPLGKPDQFRLDREHILYMGGRDQGLDVSTPAFVRLQSDVQAVIDRVLEKAEYVTDGKWGIRRKG
jgi:hypothetical protein